jgi:multimeric flavodoxin WrbA
MREVSGTEIMLRELMKVDLNQIIEFDAILIGCPNHIGRPTRNTRKFVDQFGKLDFKGKPADTATMGSYWNRGKWQLRWKK